MRLNKEIESLIVAAQGQAIKTNNLRKNMGKECLRENVEPVEHGTR